MFSLARVYLDSLKGKCSIAGIKEALNKFKTGWEAYEHAYEKTMKQIQEQIGDRAELAKRALAWLTFAQRALTLTELQHALAVVVGESSFDEENLPDVEELISSCSGLITFNEKNHIITPQRKNIWRRRGSIGSQTPIALSVRYASPTFVMMISKLGDVSVSIITKKGVGNTLCMNMRRKAGCIMPGSNPSITPSSGNS
jgi:hypothetical protein